MIEIMEASKSYGRKKALTNITLSLPPGRIVGLVGENGSGKTTLLKAIAGLVSPTKGHIQVGGAPVTRRIASKVAYMTDRDEFYTSFTIDELFRFYDSQFDDFNLVKANEIAEYLHLDRSRKIKSLSKGNRGRVKIAATLGREADVYLLDEPLSGLDPMVREDINKVLIRYTDPERQTVLLSTHEIKEVEPLLDEIVVLKEGQIVAHQSVDEIRDTYGKDVTSWMVALHREEIGNGRSR